MTKAKIPIATSVRPAHSHFHVSRLRTGIILSTQEVARRTPMVRTSRDPVRVIVQDRGPTCVESRDEAVASGGSGYRTPYPLPASGAFTDAGRQLRKRART